MPAWLGLLVRAIDRGGGVSAAARRARLLRPPRAAARSSGRRRMRGERAVVLTRRAAGSSESLAQDDDDRSRRDGSERAMIGSSARVAASDGRRRIIAAIGTAVRARVWREPRACSRSRGPRRDRATRCTTTCICARRCSTAISHFENEYVRIYQLRGGEFGTEWVYEPTATGHTRNLMSIGPALAWAPLYLVVTAATWLLARDRARRGRRWLRPAVRRIGGRQRRRWPRRSAPISRIAPAAQLHGRARGDLGDARSCGSARSAIYYSLSRRPIPTRSRCSTVGIFVLTWLTTRDRQTIGRYALVGFLGGLASLVRWQDAVLLIIPAIDCRYAGTRGGSRRQWDRALAHALRQARSRAACGACAVLAFVPQMMVWNTLYGSPFLVPQGEEFMKWTSPALAQRAVLRARADLVDADRRRRARRTRDALEARADGRGGARGGDAGVVVHERGGGGLVGRRSLRRAAVRQLLSDLHDRPVRRDSAARGASAPRLRCARSPRSPSSSSS